MESTALERSSQKILPQNSSRRKLLALTSVNQAEKRVVYHRFHLGNIRTNTLETIEAEGKVMRKMSARLDSRFLIKT